MEWCAILFQGLGKTSKSGDRSGRAVCQFCWDAQMLLGRALMQEQERPAGGVLDRRKAQAPPYLIGSDYIINNWPSAMRQVNFWIVPANIHTDRHDADRSVQQPETCVYNMCTNHVCPFRSKIFRKHSHSPVNHWIRPKGQRTPSSAIVFHTNHSQRERDTAGAPETGDENATQRGISAIRC